MSTETPRTDAAHWHGGPAVDQDFARQLERENAELRGKIGALIIAAEGVNGTVTTPWLAVQLRAILNQ